MIWERSRPPGLDVIDGRMTGKKKKENLGKFLKVSQFDNEHNDKKDPELLPTSTQITPECCSRMCHTKPGKKDTHMQVEV